MVSTQAKLRGTCKAWNFWLVYMSCHPMRSSLLSILVLASGMSFMAACTPAEAPPPVAAAASAQSANILPLRSLRLYETGVGYFERSGALGGKASALPVPAGHLDDALKSLVVLNGGAAGHVTGVAFTSSVTRATARTRAGLPQNPDSPVAFRDLLASMKGERVVITRNQPAAPEAPPKESEGSPSSPHTAPTEAPRGPIEGRVVEVTMEDDLARARALALHKDAKVDETPKRLVVSVLTTHGEVMQLAAEEIASIRPTDPAFATRLDAAMDALSTRNAQNSRALSLLGDARGDVTFGYIAETPLWRTSYRLVMGDKAELQGWALVHNDTDEDWQGVHLELVNGEPDSFIFPLAAPRYARRALVHPEEPLSTLPQLGSTTADALWGEHLDGHGAGTGTGSGYGSGHGRLGGSHSVKSPSIRMGATRVESAASSSLLSVGNLADLAPASGTEQGALFVYAVPAAFSLSARSSALVPFVKKNVEVESISFFGAVGEKARATLRFVNGTGQTLPSGTISVFGTGGFTGETSLDRLKPGERRFLEIGNDLDAEVTEKKITRKDEPRRLTFDTRRLEEHFIRTSELAWEVENRSGQPRTFYVALGASQNAKITGADRVDFDEVNHRAIAVFVVPPKTKAMRNFTIAEGLSQGIDTVFLTEKSVKATLAKSTIAAADLAVLKDSLDKVRAVENAAKTLREIEQIVSTTNTDLERFREDLKALGGNGSAPNAGGVVATPLVKRLIDAEDRYANAQKTRDAAAKALEEKSEALHQALKKLETN
jgi:hypothetical protein